MYITASPLVQMNSTKSGWVFWAAWAAAAVFMAWTTAAMPNLVAAKFGMHGEMSGWIPKYAYAASTAVVALGIPLLVATWPASLVRRGSPWARVPHGEFWMRPENRSEAAAMLKGQLQEVATLMIAYQVYRHWLVVEAHARDRRLLDVSAANASVVCLVAAVGVWVFMRYWLWTPTKTAAEGA